MLTISDSRTPDSDASGDLIEQRLAGAGHQLVERALEVDDPDLVRRQIESWLRDLRPDLIVTTGGTGLGPRDRTPEAVRPLLERELPGFGELFRWLSYRQIGAAAMLSRACAGVTDSTTIILLPGSPKAVELAMDELILPEIGHVLEVVGRK